MLQISQATFCGVPIGVAHPVLVPVGVAHLVLVPVGVALLVVVPVGVAHLVVVPVGVALFPQHVHLVLQALYLLTQTSLDKIKETLYNGIK